MNKTIGQNYHSANSSPHPRVVVVCSSLSWRCKDTPPLRSTQINSPLVYLLTFRGIPIVKRIARCALICSAFCAQNSPFCWNISIEFPASLIVVLNLILHSFWILCIFQVGGIIFSGKTGKKAKSVTNVTNVTAKSAPPTKGNLCKYISLYYNIYINIYIINIIIWGSSLGLWKYPSKFAVTFVTFVTLLFVLIVY